VKQLDTSEKTNRTTSQAKCKQTEGTQSDEHEDYIATVCTCKRTEGASRHCNGWCKPTGFMLGSEQVQVRVEIFYPDQNPYPVQGFGGYR